jgi:hypothetical protein
MPSIKTFLTRKIRIDFCDKKKIKNSLLFILLTNFLWLLFRTGTKPTRITYPCQKNSLNTVVSAISLLNPLSLISSFVVTTKTAFSTNRTSILALTIIGLFLGGSLIQSPSPKVNQEISLTIKPNNATILPASDIFVVSGKDKAAHHNELIDLMGKNNLLFYQSDEKGTNIGPEGLIASDDVVLIKFNCQWDQRGGSNTDLLKELIQTIIDHPNGFFGEIVVADNGQGRGSLDYEDNNAENTAQSVQDVVDMFTQTDAVSAYSWDTIRSNHVQEYSDSDNTDGYILYDFADPETGIVVSYPKFETEYGTKISFKYGIWNGTEYNKDNFKVINLPILKSHFNYGVTATLKNYMGVQSEQYGGGLANGHVSIATGGMATLMVELGLPTLNIIDAIWVNANPYPSSATGPPTRYEDSTRVNMLIAGTDPVALDSWAAKNVLMQTATLLGYEDVHTLDPFNTEKSGLQEAFGIWLELSKAELERGGHEVHSDGERMNVYLHEGTSNSTFDTTTETYSGLKTTTPKLSVSFTFIGLLVLFPIITIKRRKREK